MVNEEVKTTADLGQGYKQSLYRVCKMDGLEGCKEAVNALPQTKHCGYYNDGYVMSYTTMDTDSDHIGWVTCIRFRAVLMKASRLLIFFTRSALAPFNSMMDDTVLEPYCTNLQNKRESQPRM